MHRPLHVIGPLSVIYVDATHDETNIDGLLSYHIVCFNEHTLKCALILTGRGSLDLG